MTFQQSKSNVLTMSQSYHRNKFQLASSVNKIGVIISRMSYYRVSYQRGRIVEAHMWVTLLGPYNQSQSKRQSYKHGAKVQRRFRSFDTPLKKSQNSRVFTGICYCTLFHINIDWHSPLHFTWKNAPLEFPYLACHSQFSLYCPISQWPINCHHSFLRYHWLPQTKNPSRSRPLWYDMRKLFGNLFPLNKNVKVRHLFQKAT